MDEGAAESLSLSGLTVLLFISKMIITFLKNKTLKYLSGHLFHVILAETNLFPSESIFCLKKKEAIIVKTRLPWTDIYINKKFHSRDTWSNDVFSNVWTQERFWHQLIEKLFKKTVLYLWHYMNHCVYLGTWLCFSENKEEDLPVTYNLLHIQ